jgi:hypothetical protein
MIKASKVILPLGGVGPERRALVRYPCTLKTCFQLIGRDRDAGWPASVQNLSAGGIGLVLARRFEPGTLVSLRLEGVVEGSGHTLLARVVRVSPRRNGGWTLGCAFTRKLEADIFHELVREARDASRRSRRRWRDIIPKNRSER